MPAYAMSVRRLLYAKEDLIKYMEYEDCSATIKTYAYPTGRMSCTDAAAYIVQKAIYEALCNPYKSKEDKIMEGEPKVENFTKDVEIKKKVGKKGSCMQYNFILYGTHAFLTVENYDEDCNLSADFILSIAQICYRCMVDKLIFRDHKVIAISKDERYCGEDEKTKKSIWKKKSYVADCMDVDDYNPYIGATIAINKCAMDSCYKNDSKSHLRRLREKIEWETADA